MIFSVYHKEAPYVINDLHKVIKVGPKQNEFIPEGFSDITEENIGKKNSLFAEMTAQYWVWKNVDLANIEYVGFSHYRRHFDFTSRFTFHGRKTIKGEKLSEHLAIENCVKIKKCLKSHDAIVVKAKVLRGISIEKQYQTRHLPEDWEKMMNLLLEVHPDYHETAEKLFRKKWINFYQCNMFIMSVREFKKYMEWIFPILFKLEQQIDIEGYTKDQIRIIGFIAERLMTLYFRHNDMKLLEKPVLFVKN